MFTERIMKICAKVHIFMLHLPILRVHLQHCSQRWHWEKCVLVSDIPENLETIGDAGFSFRHGDSEDLKEKLQFLLENPDVVEKTAKKNNRAY